MKTLFGAALSLFLLFNSTGDAQADPSDAIENVATIAASQDVCGFDANEQMVEVAIRSLIGDPRHVQEGGKHWPEMQNNFTRIIELTKAKAGQASFCARVKHDLSAFFD